MGFLLLYNVIFYGNKALDEKNFNNDSNFTYIYGNIINVKLNQDHKCLQKHLCAKCVCP